MEFGDLDKSDRLRLMRFLCSFAWADLEVQDAEKSFVHRTVEKLGLDEEETSKVEQWLKLPPLPEEVDPTDIPVEHRQMFLNILLQLVGADGRVDSKEMETLALFERLLRPEDDDEITVM
ncbi:MAG: TerB family tellurite resistance protein [Myxococcota bacterium]